jgi:hypothetical protein
VTCDKCAGPVAAAAACATCGRIYRRCDLHDGAAGIRRSLQSHWTLMAGACPRGQVNYAAPVQP